MKIAICCPSYKRYEVKSFRFFGNILKVYVCESEYDRYVQKNPEYKECFVKVPLGVQGNVARIRNYILNDNENMDVCCIVDDDMSDRSHSSGKKKKIDYNPVVKVPIKGV